MKRLKMDISSFLLFRQVAEKYRLFFTYGYKKGGIVTVKADAKLLEAIGY